MGWGGETDDLINSINEHFTGPESIASVVTHRQRGKDSPLLRNNLFDHVSNVRTGVPLMDLAKAKRRSEDSHVLCTELGRDTCVISDCICKEKVGT